MATELDSRLEPIFELGKTRPCLKPFYTGKGVLLFRGDGWGEGLITAPSPGALTVRPKSFFFVFFN